MRYVSLFSGIEAATVAFAPLGWEPLAFCEVDPFPCAVLEKRFPEVPNLGDVKEVDWRAFVRERGAVDVVVGGSPCQSFSIAGSREGLNGASGLMYEYIRAIRDIRPRYLLWENVPGALSVERGGAFRQLLSELDALGYGLAWRVLDAQFVRVPDRSGSGFFGPVAQRRRRVFVVGVLESPHACEILFERESLRGHHPSGAKARAAIAADAPGGAGAGGAWGFLSDASAASQVGNGSGASACLDTHGDHACAMVERGSGEAALAPEELAFTLATSQDQTLVDSRRYVVRRLTPLECERLQGFPDGWTDIPYKGEEHPSDSARYKALGNSMAVPCMIWIGRRIAAFDVLHYDEVGVPGGAPMSDMPQIVSLSGGMVYR